MKKLFGILIILVLLSGTACAEEQHLQMVFSVYQPGGRTDVTADVLLREDGTLILSDLFPSFCLSIPASEGISLRLPTFSTEDFAVLPDEIVNAFPSEGFTGIYSGDLFDEAGTVQTGTAPVGDVISALLDLSEAVCETLLQLQSGQELAEELSAFLYEPELYGIQIDFSNFDSGRYYTFTGRKDSLVLFTSSFDFSEPGRVKAVFGNAEGGANYYRILEADILSDNEMKIRMAVFPDYDQAGYRAALQNQSILTENWELSVNSLRSEMSFSGEIVPGSGMSCIRISGILTAGECPSFDAELFFAGKNDAFASVSLRPGDNLADEEQKEIITLQDLDNPEALEPFANEAGVRLLSVCLDLLQVLPDEYLEKIMEMQLTDFGI